MMSDEHPIAPAVRADIEAHLAAIESAHGVRVLFACESGSRGWGFASPDSDYDVRFIYVHPLPWYLRVTPGRDVIELPVSGVLDINGWELRKALGLLKKGNATLVEWLLSPVIYRADGRFLAAMGDALHRVWLPERSFLHYLHLARGQYQQYLRGDTVRLKKYLYALRPLLAALWVEAGRGMPPMQFQALQATMVSGHELNDAIDVLLEQKRRAMEMESCAPIPAIQEFIETELTRLAVAAPPCAGDADFAVLDRLLLDTVLKTETSG